MRKGKIVKCNSNDTFQVLYDNGKKEKFVKRDNIRTLDDDSDSDDSSKSSDDDDNDDNEISVGDQVEARFGGRKRWYKATVMRKNRDGTFDLKYDDGDRERSVKRELIRKLKDDNEDSKKKKKKKASKKSKRLEVETEVEAKYRGGSRWLKGKIVKCNSNDTFQVLYDNRKKEKFVKREYIRRLDDDDDSDNSDSSDSSDSDSEDEDDNELEVGEHVEARFGGRKKWYKATVMRENRDGTYDLKYDDGDRERSV